VSRSPGQQATGFKPVSNLLFKFIFSKRHKQVQNLIKPQQYRCDDNLKNILNVAVLGTKHVSSTRKSGKQG
jgi:hypothetical protein